MPTSFRQSLKRAAAIWTGSVVGLAGVIAIVLAYSSWTNDREAKARIDDERRRKQVLIGEDTLSVKLKLGLPELRDVTRMSIWWGIPTSDKTDVSTALQFFRVGDSTALAVIQIVPGKEQWVPKDGLTLTEYSDPNETVERFDAMYGRPCETVIGDSTVKYLYALRDTDEQYIAGKKFFRISHIVRALNVSLVQGGKKVLSHGWQLAPPGNSTCSVRKKTR